jgi:hypothetical protein
LTEKANGLVCAILKKIVEVHKTDWDRKLQSAVHAYNTAVKGTTGKSPYFLVYGQDPLTPLELELKTERTFEEPELESFLEDRLDFIADLEAERELAHEKTLDVQHERKKRFDRRIQLYSVYEGDSVLLFDSRHKPVSYTYLGWVLSK